MRRNTSVLLSLVWPLLSLGTSTAFAAEVAIASIQGAGHATSLPATAPITVAGVVTAWDQKGFFLQSGSPDADPATSDGLYIFLDDKPTSIARPSVGQQVEVIGHPFEFRMKSPFPAQRDVADCGTINTHPVANTDAEHFLTLTELVGVTEVKMLGGKPVADAVELVPPGAMTSIAFSDKPNTPFDVAHPRDYFESLESMRVVIKDAVATSTRDGRIVYVAGIAHLQPSEMTDLGLPKGIASHIFPEVMKVRLNQSPGGLVLNAGAKLGDLTGVVGYDAGEYYVLLDKELPQTTIQNPSPALAAAPTAAGFRFATFNAENLSAGTTSDAKFRGIAEQIVNGLGAPSLIALQEVQDDESGNTPTLSSTKTLNKLVEAIVEAGGPRYQAISIDPPLPNADGGQLGGNIRNAFLIAPDSGVEIGSVERLFDTDDRCEVTHPFYMTRKPLLAKLKIGGEDFVFVAVHLSSKVGDVSLYSSDEDPQPSSWEERKAQATALTAELERRYGANPPRIVVLGDFNDLPFSDALSPFLSSSIGLTFASDTRGEPFRFSSAFHGIREAIDHVVVGGSLKPDDLAAVNYMDLNVDKPNQTSDHNPVVVVLK